MFMRLSKRKCLLIRDHCEIGGMKFEGEHCQSNVTSMNLVIQILAISLQLMWSRFITGRHGSHSCRRAAGELQAERRKRTTAGGFNKTQIDLAVPGDYHDSDSNSTCSAIRFFCPLMTKFCRVRSVDLCSSIYHVEYNWNPTISIAQQRALMCPRGRMERLVFPFDNAASSPQTLLDSHCPPPHPFAAAGLTRELYFPTRAC